MPTPIYLINLDRDQARLRQVTQQLQTARLPFTRLPAVDGRQLPPSAVQRLYDVSTNARCYHSDLSPGELGCYASHLSAWRQLLESGEDMALVLEDDVEVSPRLGQVLQALAALPPRWDMIKLAGRPREKPLRRWPLNQWPLPALPGLDASAVSLISYRRVPSLTAGYLLSRSGAEWLLKAHVRCWRPVDVDLRHGALAGLRLFGMLPYPVRTGPAHGQSSIGTRPGTRGGLAARWCKLRAQWAYTVACARHVRAWRATPDPFATLTLRTPP